MRDWWGLGLRRVQNVRSLSAGAVHGPWVQIAMGKKASAGRRSKRAGHVTCSIMLSKKEPGPRALNPSTQTPLAPLLALGAVTRTEEV